MSLNSNHTSSSDYLLVGVQSAKGFVEVLNEGKGGLWMEDLALDHNSTRNGDISDEKNLSDLSLYKIPEQKSSE